MTDTQVATLDSLKQGMTPVECAGQKLLLVRDGDAVRAFEGECPHAQAPLHEGALCGGRIICPWHMGSFDARTGALLEPLALRGLASYPVRIAGGAVFVTPTAVPPPVRPETTDPRCFVLVGTGAAAAMAAVTLRERGFGGEIIMVGPEPAEPLDRTLLSKMALSDDRFDRAMLALLPADEVRALRLQRRLARVIAIDAAGRTLTLSDGRALAYDAALLATGAAPVPLDLPGGDLPHVHMLRTLGDFDAIAAALRPDAPVVVIGTSFIGMEAAAALAQRKCQVTVIGAEDIPFARQFGPRVGAALRAMHVQHGVTFRTPAKIARILPDAVVLADGTSCPAAVVIAGVGVRPVTGYAADLPQGPQGGLQTDRSLRVAPHLWAAGDIAAPDGWPRIEHWRVAQQHGRIAALGMLDEPAAYDGVPFFWTTHFDSNLHYLGHSSDHDEVAYDGDVEGFDFIAWYLKDDQVQAALVAGRDHASAVLSHVLRQRLSLAEARRQI